jgi:hypothetical protein
MASLARAQRDLDVHKAAMSFNKSAYDIANEALRSQRFVVGKYNFSYWKAKAVVEGKIEFPAWLVNELRVKVEAHERAFEAWHGPATKLREENLSKLKELEENLKVAKTKNELGETLYPIVQKELSSVAESFSGVDVGSMFGITAGRITGMLLDGLTVEELKELFNDKGKLLDLMTEAAQVLVSAH